MRRTSSDKFMGTLTQNDKKEEKLCRILSCRTHQSPNHCVTATVPALSIQNNDLMSNELKLVDTAMNVSKVKFIWNLIVILPPVTNSLQYPPVLINSLRSLQSVLVRASVFVRASVLVGASVLVRAVSLSEQVSLSKQCPCQNSVLVV